MRVLSVFQAIIALVVCGVLPSLKIAEAFVVATPLSNQFASTPKPTLDFTRRSTLIDDDEDKDADDGLSPPEQTVYDLLDSLHESNFPFRLVVVGNGAILETTSILGPTFKLGKSPRTGEPLTTFASEDQSFEFHLMIAQVSKIVLSEKAGPEEGKVMQIFRFLTAEGKPMCSLILADKTEEAKKWYRSLLEKHGGDIQL